MTCFVDNPNSPAALTFRGGASDSSHPMALGEPRAPEGHPSQPLPPPVKDEAPICLVPVES